MIYQVKISLKYLYLKEKYKHVKLINSLIMKTFNFNKKGIFWILGVSLIGLSFTYASLPKKNTKAYKTAAINENKLIAKASNAKVDLKAISLNNIEFDFDKSTIRTESYKELDRIAKLLKENDGSIKLAGHADNIGEYVYNWNLSKRRAQAVKDYLMDKGANASKIAATEYGDTKPIATNATADGRQKNRRVEMVFP